MSYGYTQKPWHAGGLTRNYGVTWTIHTAPGTSPSIWSAFRHSKATYPSSPSRRGGKCHRQVLAWQRRCLSLGCGVAGIGATWRVNSSGKTVIKAYYGKLYRGILLNDFTAAIPSVTPRYYFDITSSGARTTSTLSATTRT